MFTRYLNGENMSYIIKDSNRVKNKLKSHFRTIIATSFRLTATQTKNPIFFDLDSKLLNCYNGLYESFTDFCKIVNLVPFNTLSIINK